MQGTVEFSWNEQEGIGGYTTAQHICHSLPLTYCPASAPCPA